MGNLFMYILFSLFSCFLLASECQATLRGEAFRNSKRQTTLSSPILNYGFESGLSDERLLDEIIQDLQGNLTVSGVLNGLRQRDLMSEGFLAVYNSRSVENQTINRENPRVLIRLRNSIAAFQDDSRLEVIEFDNSKKKYKMIDYNFKAEKGTYKKVNAPLCMRCHSNSEGDPTPIYDGYNTWPGFYGTNDGQIMGREWEDYSAFKSRYKIVDKESQKSQKSARTSPYSYLIDWPQLKEFPYLDRTLDHYKPSDCDPIIIGNQPPDQRTAAPAKEDIRYRFVDYGRWMYRNQQKYIIHHKILNGPLWQFRYAILGAALCPSEKFDELAFLDASNMQTIKGFDFDSFVDDTKLIAAKSYSHKVDGVNWDLNPNGDKNGRTNDEFTRDLRRVNGFRNLNPSAGRTGPFSAGFKGSTETFGIVARVRLIVETLGGEKMDWSMSAKRTTDSYIREKQNGGKPLRGLDVQVYWNRSQEDQQVNGPLDYNFAQGCFDFERPESWEEILKVGAEAGDLDDQYLLGLLEKAQLNFRPQQGNEKFGGYTLSEERELFCTALVGKSKDFLITNGVPID